MVDPYVGMAAAKGAQAYGLQKAQSSPFATIGSSLQQGLGQVPFRNPWAGALASLGGSFLGGAGSRAAQNVGARATQSAYGDIINSLYSGQAPSDPGLAPFVMQAKSDIAADKIKDSRMQKSLMGDVFKSVMVEAIKDKAGPDAARRRALGFPEKKSAYAPILQVLGQELSGGTGTSLGTAQSVRPVSAPEAPGVGELSPVANQPMKPAGFAPPPRPSDEGITDVPPAEAVLESLGSGQSVGSTITPPAAVKGFTFEDAVAEARRKGGGPEMADAIYERRTKATQRELDQTTKLAKDFNNSKIVQNYVLSDVGFRALSSAIKDTSGASDFEIIRRAAQAVEPGLAVRKDDQDSIEGAASALGMTSAFLNNLILGESRLDDKTRNGLMRIAKRSYDQYSSKFRQKKRFTEKTMDKFGLDKSLLTELRDPEPSENIWQGSKVGQQKPFTHEQLIQMGYEKVQGGYRRRK